MPILHFIRLAILSGFSSRDYATRSRAHHVAARLSRRHGFNAKA